VAVDETKPEVDDYEVSVWAVVDCDTLRVLHVNILPGRSGLDALLFLREVLEACRGRPLVRVDRGP
jgi:putative transposase